MVVEVDSSAPKQEQQFSFSFLFWSLMTEVL